MKYIYPRILFLLFIFNVSISSLLGQVTIGSNQKPAAGTLLDLKEDGATTKGLGLPCVELQSTGSLLPCADESENNNASKHIGLIVYNVATQNDVCPGMYVWDGDSWKRVYNKCNASLQLSSVTIDKSISNISVLTPSLSNNDGIVRSYTWTSSNSSIASVDATGTITGLMEGNTTVTATSDDGLTASCNVLIVDNMAINNYKIRLYLTDKGSPYSISNPSQFLSQKSINRRIQQNIGIDKTDLPISTDYYKAIIAKGGTVVTKSKWAGTIVVHCADRQIMDDILSLPFVDKAELVWKDTKASGRSSLLGSGLSTATISSVKSESQLFASSSDYGSAWKNIHTNNGEFLHDAGYKGQGMDIAIIDAGFDNINTLSAIYNMNIQGAMSMIYNSPSTTDVNVYGQHGLWVLSCMAANKPGTFVGTAPDANYWLFRTEDSKGVAPIQEDYWIAAAEYADSVGVDMINTSLGYKIGYSTPFNNYTFNQTDGQTIFLSRGVDIAIGKGIFVVASAGNDQGWVTTPADAKNVLTVGGIKTDGNIYNDSSKGNTADGRIKPEVVALGQGTSVVNPNGSIGSVSGTSFATPALCGMIACLWQAFPQLSNKEIRQAVLESADKYNTPILPFGYGKPDMQIAMGKAQAILDAK